MDNDIDNEEMNEEVNEPCKMHGGHVLEARLSGVAGQAHQKGETPVTKRQAVHDLSPDQPKKFRPDVQKFRPDVQRFKPDMQKRWPDARSSQEIL